MGSTEMANERKVSQVWRSDDTCGSCCAGKGNANDDSKVRCEVSVLQQTGNAKTADKVFNGGIQIMEIDKAVKIAMGALIIILRLVKTPDFHCLLDDFKAGNESATKTIHGIIEWFFRDQEDNE